MSDTFYGKKYPEMLFKLNHIYIKYYLNQIIQGRNKEKFIYSFIIYYLHIYYIFIIYYL